MVASCGHDRTESVAAAATALGSARFGGLSWCARVREREDMRYREFGRTGMDVSDVAHGLWGMSGWKDSEDKQSVESLQLSADLGCNFYDTAWAYGEGKSDGFLGRLLRKNSGKRLFHASKVPPKNRKWPALAEYSYADTFPGDYVLEMADRIRRQLEVDAIDLLQFHVWDDSWTDEPDFRNTVEKLKRDGTIRYFGLSLNRWEPWNGLKAIRTGLVDAVQVIYNIFDQAPEDELFPLCRERKVGVIARVPLDEGSLGGKLTAETKFPEGDFRHNYFGPENLAATLPRVEKLKSLLPEGMTLPEMAIRFILSNADVCTTIVGMRKPEHVRANLSYSDAGPLDPALRAELKKHRWDRKPKPWSA
jgi:aryl-alcohol dehydrogenase-like predicted oxidoreductase